MRRPALSLAAVCAFWGTIPTLADWSGLPPVALVSARVWLATLGIGIWLLVRRPPGPAAFTLRRPTALAVGITLAFHWTAMFAGYEAAPDGTVAFVIFLAPVLIALGAPFVLDERLTQRTVVALAVGVAGFVVLAAPDLEGPGAAGVAWAAASGISLAGLVLAAKPLAQVYGGLRLTFMQMSVAGVVLVPLAATAGWGSPRADWGWAVVLGLVHTAIGVVVYLSVLARIPATHVGIISYFEPVAVVVIGVGLGSEPLRLPTIIGGMLVIVAGTIVLRTRPPIREEVQADALPR